MYLQIYLYSVECLLRGITINCKQILSRLVVNKNMQHYLQLVECLAIKIKCYQKYFQKRTYKALSSHISPVYSIISCPNYCIYLKDMIKNKNDSSAFDCQWISSSELEVHKCFQDVEEKLSGRRETNMSERMWELV